MAERNDYYQKRIDKIFRELSEALIDLQDRITEAEAEIDDIVARLRLNNAMLEQCHEVKDEGKEG